MAFTFMGCNPEETWADAALAPPVGTVGTKGDDEYVLVKAKGAITQYDCCIITGKGEADQATSALADDSYPLCVPQVAIADDNYGWGLIKGDGRVNAANSCAADTSLSTTANAGIVDDADTAGRISGMMLTSAQVADRTAQGANLWAPMWCFNPRLDILA